MGCICSKGAAEDPAEKGSNKLSSKLSNKFSRKFSSKLSSKLSRRFVAPSIREEVIAEADDGGSEGKGRLISTPQENLVNTTPLVFDEGEKKVVVERPRKTAAAHQRRATVDIGENGGELNFRIVNAPNVLEEERVAVGWPSRIVNVPNALEGEQVAAGWPSWLTAVAAEAIKGWVPRRADSFEKLDKIGQGTYSSVYKARDLETGKVVALKKVRFMNMDPESVRFMSREIHILRRLDHPNVVKLEGLITSRMSGSLYLVFEYMEHDLTGLAATPGIKFTEPQVKCYMHQLLHGLEHCNSRGVLHRDIKGSNLLIDNNGNLKIADFGLATFFHPDQKQPLTSRVVTLWYRPPELLLGATEYGCAVDLWSTGCILAELFAGKPIMPGRTEVEQLHKIFKLCGSPSDEYFKKSRLSHATIFKPTHPYKRRVVETFKDFPSSALALMNILLAIEPADRGTAASALKSEFFTMQPLACDPSSLPKYPPSKELDAKQRDEEARRQRARASKEYGEISAPDAHAELQPSVQKQHVLSNAKSNGEKYSPQEDNDFSVIPPKVRRNSISHSGPLLLHPDAIDSSRNKVKVDEIDNISVLAFHESTTQRSYMPQGSTDLSNLSGLVAARNNAKSDNRRERSTNPHWPEERMNGGYERLEAAERSGRKEWPHQLLDRPNSSQNKGARMGSRDSSVGYGPKKKRIHYSGPLLPPGGNIDEMLKEHERQIQQAVRKARLDKVKSKKN